MPDPKDPHALRDHHRRPTHQFAEDGYFILESIIPYNYLELLRSECQAAIDRCDAAMDAGGTDSQGLNHRGRRYFASNVRCSQPRLNEFLFSELMADICQATLGDNAYLFWEQYVVKGADKGMKFAWHQDSGYVENPDHEPYLTCWCALDDMSEANGTVHVMPFSRIGIRSWVKHVRQQRGDGGWRAGARSDSRRGVTSSCRLGWTGPVVYLLLLSTVIFSS